MPRINHVEQIINQPRISMVKYTCNFISLGSNQKVICFRDIQVTSANLRFYQRQNTSQPLTTMIKLIKFLAMTKE